MEAGLSEHLPGKRRAIDAGIQNNVPIDQHISDAFWILHWIGECSFVDDRLRIEDDDVREIARLQQASTLESENFGWLGRHFANRILQRQGSLLANIFSQDAWK